MLKLTIKPGEFINIGEDIRVVYSGGSEGNIHLLIDAPRELNCKKQGACKKQREGRQRSITLHFSLLCRIQAFTRHTYQDTPSD